MGRLYYWLVAISILLIFVSGLVNAENFSKGFALSGNGTTNSSALTGSSTSYSIYLLEGVFTPTQQESQNISSYFQSLNLSDNYSYVFVQFLEAGGDPTDEDAQNLSSNNVTLFNKIAESTYIAKFPKQILENINFDFIRWIDLINSTNKSSSGLRSFALGHPNDTLNLTIFFFEGLDSSQQNKIISFSNYLINNNSNFTFLTMNMNASLFSNITDLNFVKFVENYSLPIGFLDRASRLTTVDYYWGGTGASGVTVGVSDSGLQFNHPTQNSYACTSLYLLSHYG